MKKCLIGLAVMCVAVVCAQELLPELAAPAATYKAAVEALAPQRQEAVAKAAQPYVKALMAVEKRATSKGDLDLIAAAVKEREAAKAGTLEPEVPQALAKSRLSLTRKRLQGDIDRIDTDFEKRRKQADIGYLRSLAALQMKAAADPELAKQIAAQKAAVLEGGGNSGNGPSSAAGKVARGKNVIINGDFEKVVDGKPDGWIGDKLTLETENGNHFGRMDVKSENRDGSGDTALSRQEMQYPIPGKAECIVISAKIRTQNVKVDPAKFYWPCVHVCFVDDKNKEIRSCQLQAKAFKNGSWKEFSSNEHSVPIGAVVMTIRLYTGSCVGQVDFDDVEVAFK